MTVSFFVVGKLISPRVWSFSFPSLTEVATEEENGQTHGDQDLGGDAENQERCGGHKNYAERGGPSRPPP